MGGLFSLFGGEDAPQAILSQYDLNKSRLAGASTQIQDLGLALSGYNKAMGLGGEQRSYIGKLKSDAERQMQMRLSGLAIGGEQARSMGLAGGAGWQTSGLLGAAMRKNELQKAMDVGMQMDTSAYDMASINAPYQAMGLAQGFLNPYLIGRTQETQMGLSQAGQLTSMGMEQNMFNVGQQNQRNIADWQNKQSFMNSMLGGVMGMGGSMLGGWSTKW